MHEEKNIDLYEPEINQQEQTQKESKFTEKSTTPHRNIRQNHV